MKKLRGIIVSMLIVLIALHTNIEEAGATGLSDNADLSGITVQQVLSTGETKDVTLTPAFSPEITTYNAVLEPECVKLVMTPTTADPSATTTTHWPDMDPGENRSWVEVKAVNGTTKSYTIYSKVLLPEETTTEPETTEDPETSPETENSDDEDD